MTVIGSSFACKAHCSACPGKLRQSEKPIGQTLISLYSSLVIHRGMLTVGVGASLAAVQVFSDTTLVIRALYKI